MVMNFGFIFSNWNYFLYFQKDLLEINQVYEQKYHKSVKEAVKSSYSGDLLNYSHKSSTVTPQIKINKQIQIKKHVEETIIHFILS